MYKGSTMSGQLSLQRGVSQEIKLGELLLRKHLISREHLMQALNHQAQTGLRLGEYLVVHHHLQPEDLNQCLQEQTWRRKGFWVIDDTRCCAA
jgi:hypothetical protein